MAMEINRAKLIPGQTDIDDEMPMLVVPEEKEIPEPEPVVFDPEQPAKYTNMAEAIKAAQWELVHPEQPAESFVGTRNIWVVTEDELLAALPPDVSYPIYRAATTANRDIQPFLAGFLGAMTTSTGHRFNAIASNRVTQPIERTEAAEFAAWKANVAAHEVIHPLTLWVIVIAEVSVGNPFDVNLECEAEDYPTELLGKKKRNRPSKPRPRKPGLLPSP